ncbi:Acetyltransferase (GNAT) family protein [compost metagenome]
MIQRIPLETHKDILELLSLQVASYRVEAELIGFDEIPLLNDGIASIQEADEIFIGSYTDALQLRGAISYHREGKVVTICRMMVHPEYFRLGIARELLRFVIDGQCKEGASRFIVSTGTANIPAIKLYQGFGFIEKKVRTIASGITLTTFERPANLE